MKKITLLLFGLLFSISLMAQEQVSLTKAIEAGLNYTKSSSTIDNKDSAKITPIVQRAITSTFTDRTSFQTAAPNLTLEDFEGGAAPNTFSSCGGGTASSNSGSCFPPGELQPGVVYTATGGDLVVVGQGNFGNPNPTIGSNFFADFTTIDFTNNDVGSFGFDLYTFFNPTTVEIRIYGTSGLINSYSVTTSNPSFFGAIADEIITRVEVEDLAGIEAEHIALLEFGQPSFPPVIACPSDIMANTDPSECGAIVNFADAIALDAEDGPITAVQTMGPSSGSQFPTGDTIVEFTATDSDGNESSCQFTVTVTDMEAPEALCQNLTLDLMGGSSVSITPADIDNGSSDNCGIVDYSLDMDTFTCANTGDNTVTLTVTDEEGNSTTCTATVTIQDTTAPEITCVGEPGIFNILEEFEAATIPAGWSTVVESGVDDWAFGSGDMPGSTDDFPTNAAIFDDDAAGSGQVNLVRLLSPVYDISAAASADLNFDYSLQDFLGEGEISVEVWDGSAWQEILFATEDTPPTSLGVTDMMPFANPDFQVRFTYDDNGGFGWGAGVDNFALNYELSTSPPFQVTLDASGNATISADDLIQTVNEACGYNATFGGSAPITETVTDAPGLTIDATTPVVSSTISITEDLPVSDLDVNLNIPHEWVGDLIIQLESPSGTVVTIMDQPGVPASTFGCGSDNIEATLDDEAASPVEDECGPVDMAIFGTFSPNNPLSAFDGESTMGDWTLTITDTFAAGDDGELSEWGLTYSSLPNATMDFDCSNLGENQVEVFVTDDSGNSSSCTATVNVVDITAPIITCAGNPGPVSITEEFEGSTIPDGWSTVIDAGVHDWTFGSGDMPTGDDFPTNAAIFDDDAAGIDEVNIATLYSPVYDITGAATASLSFDYAFQEISSGETFVVEVYDGAAWQEILSLNVDTPLTNTGAIDMVPYLNANFQVRFTYDDNGTWGWAAGIDNFILNYEITEITPVDIALGPDGTATIDPNSLIQNVDEACGISTVASDITEVSCADIGTPMTITIFASDASGNIASCTAEINVVDTVAPEVTCPEDQSVDPGEGNLFYEVPDYFATGEGSALDNCTDPVSITTQDPAPGELIPDGEYTVTLTAEDEYGNVGTCTFQLTVESVLGVDDNSLSSSIAMYPNPADSQVTITNKSNIALQNAVVYDINGKLISQYDLSNMQGERVIDVSALASGVYVVQITSDKSSVSKRLIKK